MPALPILFLALAASPDRECISVLVSRAGDEWSVGPAFHLRGGCTRVAAPGGGLALEGRSRSGRSLFRIPVAVTEIAGGGSAHRASGPVFAEVDPGTRDALASLRLVDGERVLAERTRGKGGRLAVRAVRDGGEGVKLTWNAAAYPYALVRDPGTERREVIGQLEGGSATLVTRARRLEVVLSDGVGGRRVFARVR